MDINAQLASIKRERVPSEFDRIVGFPLDFINNPKKDNSDLIDYWTEYFRWNGSEATLRASQAIVCETLKRYGSALAVVSVGHGKSLSALLAGAVVKAKNPLILVPPALVTQMKEAAQYWSLHFNFIIPRIESYGILSTKTDLLSTLAPDLIVADEAHYLKNKQSNRTKRFIRYFQENPSCKFLGLSGTITNKSLLDYDHLLYISLRERAPIPFDKYRLQAWAACLDPDGEPTKADILSMSPLHKWAEEHFPKSASNWTMDFREKIRKSYRLRLFTTPGVIITVPGSCSASLYLVNSNIPHSKKVKKALKDLDSFWMLPNKEPLADASIKSSAYKNLSLGFYYTWDWGETGVDEEWLQAKRRLNREIGIVLRYSSLEGRDSPALVKKWVEAGGGNDRLRKAYWTWENIKHRASPKTVPIWICKEKIEYISKYLRNSSVPIIAWYKSLAIEEAFREEGFDIYGAGSSPPKGDTCLASIAVHGKGRNLQQYSNCLIMEPPSGGAAFEQLLGRTHRSGQLADAVYWHYLDYGNSLKRAKSHAEYIEQSTGTIQKLNQATLYKQAFGQ